MDVIEAKQKLEFIASENPREYAKRLLDLYNSCTAPGKPDKEARMEAVDLLWEGIEPKGKADKRLQREKENCQSLCELAITTCYILFCLSTGKDRSEESGMGTVKELELLHTIYDFFQHEAPEHICPKTIQMVKDYPPHRIALIRS